MSMPMPKPASASASAPLPRKIAIVTLGSRGDIQPYVAIGVALRRAGCDVRVLTNAGTHATLLDQFGLSHVAFGSDTERSLAGPAMRRAMAKGDAPGFIREMEKIFDRDLPGMCRVLHDETTAARPDLLIASFPLALYFGHYARHVLGIPTLYVGLQQPNFEDPTRAPLGLPTLPFGLHRHFFTKLIMSNCYKTFKTMDRTMREFVAAEGAAPAPPPLDRYLLREQLPASSSDFTAFAPILFAQSPLIKGVLSPHVPDDVRFVGAAVLDARDQLTQPARRHDDDAPDHFAHGSFGGDTARDRIAAFLAADIRRKPLYMGWGSMISSSSGSMTVFAVRALMLSQQRGIVLGGWAKLGMEALEEEVRKSRKEDSDGPALLAYAKANILFLEQIPHEWLFPQVSLTIHHGGAGTTAVALRAGVPTIITPVFLDQFDHSYVVEQLGVGIGFKKQLQQIRAEELAAAIENVLGLGGKQDPVSSSSDMTVKARQVSALMRKECGTQAVVDEVTRYWKEEVTTGAFESDVDRWKIATQTLRDAAERQKSSRYLILFGTLVAIFASLLMFRTSAFI